MATVPVPFPTMTTSQMFQITPQFLDAKGKPAPVEAGSVTYGSSDLSVANVVADPGGLTAMVLAQGVGDYSISVNADADLGAGVVTISGANTGTITANQAVAVGFLAGPVQEQP